MTIQLELPGNPIPWRAPYVGRVGSFSPNTKALKAARAYLKEQYSGPLLGDPLEMDLKFIMPIPSSISKKKRKEMLQGKIRPTTTPDRDNLQKFISDVLQDVIYINDKLVVSGRSEKWYGQNPRTLITVRIVTV